MPMDGVCRSEVYRGTAVALEKEMEAFRRELPALLADPVNVGRYVLIGGDPAGVVGVYATFDAALASGYDTFGLASFLVKEVTDHEKPHYFSRNLRCPP